MAENEPNPNPSAPDPPASAPAPGAPQPGSAAWLESLEPDLKGSASLQKFKDPGTLARSYLALEKEMGSRAKLPDFEKADPKEVDGFWGKLGVPNAPEGYKFEVPKFPEGSGLEFAPEDLQVFAKMAHDARLTPKAAQHVLNTFAQRVIEAKSRSLQDQAATRQETEKTLRDAWGVGYEMNMSYSERVVQQFGDDEIKAGIEASGIANQPWFRKLTARLGRAMGEDNLLVGESAGLTVETAKSELEKIKTDPDYWKNDNRQKHDALVARAYELQRMIDGA